MAALRSMIMSDSRLDQWMSAGFAAMLPAVALLFFLNWQFQTTSIAVYCVLMLGALCGATRSYKSERGVWMLAAVLGLPLVVPYLAMVASQGFPAGLGWGGVLRLADVTAATLVLGVALRVTVSIIAHNRALAETPAETVHE